MSRLLILLSLLAAVSAEARPIVALCYHDVVETEAEALMDPNSVTVDTLVQHFSWLEANGYQAVSLAQWQGGAPLPDKPVLLTFDDGYASVRSHVLPLLELFNFRAVVAPVTGWMDVPNGEMVDYGGQPRPRADFLSWDELREVHASGLIEVASHTDNLHRGLPGNAGGSLLPAGAVRAWHTQRYETDAEYLERLKADLRRSAVRLTEELEVLPAAVAWPYGAYNKQMNEVAWALGLEQVMTLDDEQNTRGSPYLHRRIVTYKTDLRRLKAMLEGDVATPLRAAHVRLDDVFDADPQMLEQNVDALVERINTLAISGVFLQAFADQDGNGRADALYFPSRMLPTRSDLFSRVAWALKTRADVNVYAWLPVHGFDRASLTEADVRAVYDDLGRYARVDGVLFHEAFLSRDDIALTDRLAAALRPWQGKLRTVRSAPLDSGWLQRLPELLDAYDYVALTGAGLAPRSAAEWIEAVEAVHSLGPEALEKTAFHLLTSDGAGTPVPNAQLAKRFDRLLRAGARHLAYFPDGVATNHPDARMVRAQLSTNWYPAVKR